MHWAFHRTGPVDPSNLPPGPSPWLVAKECRVPLLRAVDAGKPGLPPTARPQAPQEIFYLCARPGVLLTAQAWSGPSAAHDLGVQGRHQAAEKSWRPCEDAAPEVLRTGIVT